MRYAASACYRCLALRRDPVRLTGEPTDTHWFGFLLVDLTPVHKED